MLKRLTKQLAFYMLKTRHRQWLIETRKEQEKKNSAFHFQRRTRSLRIVL